MKTLIRKRFMKSLACGDMNKSDLPRMKTRRVAPLLFTLAVTCFFGLPANSRAQGTPELALVTWYCTPTGSLCGLGPALVFPGGMTDNPNDRAPTWSPDGMRIAFERDGEILVIDIAGGSPTNLTNHPASDRAPAWSPDGAKIAFASDRDGQAELYLMNPDGAGVIRLTNSIGFTGDPAWSPDSAKIAFTCVIESDNHDICRINADGTGFVRLTTDPAWDYGPAWSPDGSRIAFSTARYSSNPLLGPMQLAMMNPDGSGVSQVSDTLGGDPSWSPDGTRLVFAGGMLGNSGVVTLTVWLINADGTGLTELGEGFDPAWRPVLSGPAVALSPGSLAFGSQLVGTTSNPLNVSLTNTGGSNLTISGIAVNGDFAQTDTCGNSIVAGATCSITVRFAPTATGPRSGAVTITDNAAGSPHLVSLSGTGTSNNPPVASFVSACTGLTCNFNGSASSDSDGTITSYAWSFGDGATGSGPTVSHTYTAGTYTVRLTVTDNGGATATQAANVTASQAFAYMHVGDLDRASTKQGNTWTAIVTITIQDSIHNRVPSATVSGSWSTGGTGSCTTSASGQCTVSKSGISKNIASVTFTVGNVTHATLTYKAADNQDPDGDSNGTSIALNKP